MLWGQDASNLYGKTITTGGGKYTEVLPTSISATTPDVSGMLTCLSCHDGNYASNSMMKNKVYESLPTSYGQQRHSDSAGQGRLRSQQLPERAPLGLSAKVELRRSR